MARGQSYTGALLATRYRIGRELDRGGMGAIYEAVQEDLGRRVAIKVLHPHLTDDAGQLARFRREAEAAAALNHQNIVQVTDFQHAPGEPPILVMEFLLGEPLARVLANEAPLADHRVAFIGSQVLDALGAAHDAGIIHRDLKPGNIFLLTVAGVRDIVKLLDFGIAKLKETDGYRRLTATGALVGTPAYMAPEQARAEPLDGRADLYAAGVVMYGCLAGELPFFSENPGEVLRAILTQPVPPLANKKPGVDPRLAAIVERALAKNKEDRFKNAHEMRRALLEIIPSAPTKLASLEAVIPDHIAAQADQASTEKSPIRRTPSVVPRARPVVWTSDVPVVPPPSERPSSPSQAPNSPATLPYVIFVPQVPPNLSPSVPPPSAGANAVAPHPSVPPPASASRSGSMAPSVRKKSRSRSKKMILLLVMAALTVGVASGAVVYLVVRALRAGAMTNSSRSANPAARGHAPGAPALGDPR